MAALSRRVLIMGRRGSERAQAELEDRSCLLDLARAVRETRGAAARSGLLGGIGHQESGLLV